jgi:hypothetical protein
VTLLPSSEFGIKGHPGKPYDVNERCAHPTCAQLSAHSHHLWSRSFLRGQPYEWVQLPDGTVIGNRLGLCQEHHEQVTGEIGGYKARIVFSGGLFYWEDRIRATEPWIEEHRARDGVSVWTRVGLLDPQPPGIDHETIHPVIEETCPTCGHTKRKQDAKPSEPRKTSEWTLKVPRDAEIGAEVLDGWADDLAVILGFSDETSRLRRYHAVATALAWTVQNRDEFVADLVAARV